MRFRYSAVLYFPPYILKAPHSIANRNWMFPSSSLSLIRIHLPCFHRHLCVVTYTEGSTLNNNLSLLYRMYKVCISRQKWWHDEVEFTRMKVNRNIYRYPLFVMWRDPCHPLKVSELILRKLPSVEIVDDFMKRL